jgi:hypothetical protein
MEHDHKTFRAGNFPGLERDGVIGPFTPAGDRAHIVRFRQLLQPPILCAPAGTFAKQFPTLCAFAKIRLEQYFSVRRGDLDVLEFRRGIPSGDTNHATLCGVPDHRRFHFGRQIDIAAIFGKQLLDVITRQAIPPGTVEIIQVRIPGTVVQVHQQRSSPFAPRRNFVPGRS